MSATITASDIIAATRKMASERAGTTYGGIVIDGTRRCRYDAGSCSDGTVGCLFGQVLATFGISTPKNYVGSVPSACNSSGINFSARQYDWVEEVQRRQDAGEMWGVAVERADGRYPLGDNNGAA